MAFYDKDKIKLALTPEQIYEFAEHIGGEPVMTEEAVVLRTICHNGSNEGSDKLYYYDNTKLFNCYTGCGSMDIFELYIRVCRMNDGVEKTFYQAMDAVATFFGLEGVEGDREVFSGDEDDLAILRQYNILLDKEEDNKLSVEYKIYDDTVLNNLSFVAPLPWLQEGITVEAMKTFGIKYYGTDHRMVIPHYNIQGDLIGIRGRAMNQRDAEMFGKYTPLSISGKMYNHPLSHNLYGLDLNLENVNNVKKIIIFEGEKSVIHYESIFGRENNIAVATCGSSLSIVQEAMIKKFCNVDEVIFAYDKEFKKIGDSEFDRNTELLIRLAERLNNYFAVSFLFDRDKDNQVLDYKDAPIDKGKEVFEHLYSNRVFI